MQKYFRILGSVAALSMLGACGSSSNEDTTTSGGPGSVPSTIGEVPVKPGALLISIDSSMSSMGSSVGAALGGSATGSLRLDEGEGDIGCDDDKNYPVDLKDATKNTNGNMRDTDPRFGTGLIYCALTNKLDNATSVQGSYFMPKVFACALSDVSNAALDGEDHEIELNITKACFGSLLDDPDTGLSEGQTIAFTFRGTASPSIEGWDLDISLKIADGSDEYRMFFHYEEDKKIAFSSYSKGTQSFGDDVVSVAVDLENGELRYVYRRMIIDCDEATGDDLLTCYGKATNDQWQGTVHNALLAKGAFNASGEFTSLDHLSGVVSKSYSGYTEPVVYGAEVHTLSGSLTGGLTSRTYKAYSLEGVEDFRGIDNYTEIAEAIMCWKDEETPSEGACTDVAGIKFDSNDHTNWLLHPADTRVKRHKAWFEQGPLDFTSIDFSNSDL